ncbi:MAG: AAA family ATPase [Acidilobaceae archaeon]
MSRIFRDRFVFEESYKPSKLVVRSAEAELLIRRYLSKLSEAPGFSDVSLIYGSIGRVGIGKTTLAWYVGRRVEELSRQRGVNAKFVYVNAFGAPALHQILQVMVDQLGLAVSVRGSSAVEVLKAIVDHLYLRDRVLLVAIDEFQSLLLSPRMTEDDLYLLMRVYEEIPSRDGLSRIAYLLVASDHRVLSYLRERIPQVESQIGFRMHLRPYTSQELKAILLQRAEEGLQPGAWEEYHLDLISEYFGDDRGGDGSARRAIMALRMAAELAEAEESPAITEAHVRRALSEQALSTLSISELRGLSTHELLVLYSVARATAAKGGWSTTGEVKKLYEDTCQRYGETPRGHTQFHTYLKSLSVAGLIEVRLSSKGMRGRTSLIRLAAHLPPDRVMETLDSILLDRLGEASELRGRGLV